MPLETLSQITLILPFLIIFLLSNCMHTSFRPICTPPSSRTTHLDTMIDVETMKLLTLLTPHLALTLTGTGIWIWTGAASRLNNAKSLRFINHGFIAIQCSAVQYSAAQCSLVCWGSDLPFSLPLLHPLMMLSIYLSDVYHVKSFIAINLFLSFIDYPTLVLVSRGARCVASAGCSLIEARTTCLLTIFSPPSLRISCNLFDVVCMLCWEGGREEEPHVWLRLHMVSCGRPAMSSTTFRLSAIYCQPHASLHGLQLFSTDL